MRTADHLLLGQYLLAHYAAPALQRHRRAFLLGCVEPDGNVFSYLRGMRHREKLRGHHAEPAAAGLTRTMAEGAARASGAACAPQPLLAGEPPGAPGL